MGIDVDVAYTTNTTTPEYLAKLPFDHITADLSTHKGVKSLYDAYPKADIIFHCATYGQPTMFMENKISTLSLNTLTTTYLMDYWNPEKFLFLSTSELYSGLASTDYREEQIGTTNTTHPRACYIEGKRCGEAICDAFRERGIDAKSIRLCLAYGPGTKVGDKRALNSFVEKALTQKKITLIDSGDSMRTYGYISDCVYMIWKILLEGKQSIYNVGGIYNISIRQMAELIGQIINVPIIIPETNNGLVGTPINTHLNLTRFFEEFGTTKFITLHDGLKRTIEWQKGLYL